jgi:hypothetical protein
MTVISTKNRARTCLLFIPSYHHSSLAYYACSLSCYLFYYTPSTATSISSRYGITNINNTPNHSTANRHISNKFDCSDAPTPGSHLLLQIWTKSGWFYQFCAESCSSPEGSTICPGSRCYSQNCWLRSGGKTACDKPAAAAFVVVVVHLLLAALLHATSDTLKFVPALNARSLPPLTSVHHFTKEHQESDSASTTV